MPMKVTPATIASSSTCPICDAKSSIQTTYSRKPRKIKSQKCISCDWTYKADE